MRLANAPTALLVAVTWSAESTAQWSGEPFEEVEAVYLGQAITGRPYPLYEWQPCAMFDPTLGDQTFQMWWLGRYNPADPDAGPHPAGGSFPDDRIYYAHRSLTGAWSSPRVVIKGSAGLGPLEADDHFVGSPSVLRLNQRYYMFYEAFATVVTPINRFFSPSRSDTWVDDDNQFNPLSPTYGNGPLSVDFHSDYTVYERHLGFAPTFAKAETHPIYSGEVTYSNGKVNRFLSAAPVVLEDRADGSRWRPLNNGEPVFWLYDEDGPGRLPLYAAFDGAFANSFATNDPNFEGKSGDGFNGWHPPDPLLGYSAAALDGPDLLGCMQNRVCMAYSDDLLDWTKFVGPARGGAILTPSHENTTSYSPTPNSPAAPTDTWTVDWNYGAGYPSALVRDDVLEIHFLDLTSGADGCVNASVRVRLPVSGIENAGAYGAASSNRECSTQVSGQVTAGSDIRWSPMHQRYFTFWVESDTSGVPPSEPCPISHPNFQHSPMLNWTNVDDDVEVFPSSPPINGLGNLLPTNVGNTTIGRWGTWGAIASTPLGHTLDFPHASPPYTAFHLFYAATDAGAPGCADAVFHYDLDHLLVFGYASDRDGDGVLDNLDGCPDDPMKTEPGHCGCGIVDSDSDSDGTPDCIDECPNDPNKSTPGSCGCGISDIDSDGDGVPDCLDPCRFDPNKIEPGVCGCGIPDLDGDLDRSGTVDISDLNIVLGNFATFGPRVPGDVNGDNQVNITDLNLLLGNFSSSCY